MDTDLRVSLVAAGSAATLSSIVGAIAGVGFLPLVLRALIGGLLFGALAFGALFVARRVLPGLENAASRSEDVAYGTDPSGQAKGTFALGLDGDSTGEEATRGRKIDIVLPGEGPDEEATAVEDEFPAESPETAYDALSVSSTPDQISRTLPKATPSFVARESALMQGDSLLDDEDGQGEAAVPRAALVPAGQGGDIFDELDVLPDLEGFSDSFAAPEYREAAGKETVGATRGARAGSGSTAGSPDPAALAQAVRTILKRDQKG